MRLNGFPSSIISNKDPRFTSKFWGHLHQTLNFVKIIDKRIKLLMGKQISLVKVIWNEAMGDVAWELEEKNRKSYPHLFE